MRLRSSHIVHNMKRKWFWRKIRSGTCRRTRKKPGRRLLRRSRNSRNYWRNLTSNARTKRPTPKISSTSKSRKRKKSTSNNSNNSNSTTKNAKTNSNNAQNTCNPKTVNYPKNLPHPLTTTHKHTSSSSVNSTNFNKPKTVSPNNSTPSKTPLKFIRMTPSCSTKNKNNPWKPNSNKNKKNSDSPKNNVKTVCSNWKRKKPGPILKKSLLQ